MKTVSSIQRPVIGDYLISSTIGYGSSGRVKLGIHTTTGQQVAIKIISRKQLSSSKTINHAVERELAILQLLQHPNLISLYQVLQDENNVYFITEYAPGGELYHVLSNGGRIQENEAREIFGQIGNALAWCHAHHICHRDLKPENILLDKEKKNIKIADFGMATMQPTNRLLKTSCGSPHYASPEVIRGIPYYGPAADVWSAGIILYVLLVGQLPFDDRHIGKLLKKIKRGCFKVIPNWVTAAAKDLIYRMLTVDPSKRMDFAGVLSHPWMTSFSANSTNSYENQSDMSLYSFSLRFNPYHEIRLRTSASLNPDDLDGPTRETLKVLWRDLSFDQIIAALSQESPNAQKSAYLLLRQKRNSKATDSTEANLVSQTSLHITSNSEPCDIYKTGEITEPLQQSGGTFISIVNSDTKMARNTNPTDFSTKAFFNSVSPKLEPNRPTQRHHFKRKVPTLDTFFQIYTLSKYKQTTMFDNSSKRVIKKQNPTVHITTIDQYQQAFSPTTSYLLLSLARQKEPELGVLNMQNFKTYLLSLHNLHNEICLFVKKSLRNGLSIFTKRLDNSSRAESLEFSVRVNAKSKYVAAGKLYYILHQHFEGKLNGHVYPEGNILWSGEIDVTNYVNNNRYHPVSQQQNFENIVPFQCKISTVFNCKAIYEIKFKIHRKSLALENFSIRQLLVDLVAQYESEALASMNAIKSMNQKLHKGSDCAAVTR